MRTPVRTHGLPRSVETPAVMEESQDPPGSYALCILNRNGVPLLAHAHRRKPPSMPTVGLLGALHTSSTTGGMSVQRIRSHGSTMAFRKIEDGLLFVLLSNELRHGAAEQHGLLGMIHEMLRLVIGPELDNDSQVDVMRRLLRNRSSLIDMLVLETAASVLT